MHSVNCPTTQLKYNLFQLLKHEVSNPDDDPHWSGVMFFCATDEHTRTLIEQIEILASEAFFDPRGRAIHHRLRAAAVEGIRVRQVKNASPEETVIRITLPERGYITVSALRL
ncbi:hypothetical protein PS627_00556 [Pseudomonas fluorescens]|uniref:hypothetical protein n=1 Tax=Pseudomonas fluorescens TaxID=294 RepID=UPI00125A2809|nr:hypothetical protein [Pseudomonas fluorescens]CAG8863618.1 hypothetical protein PS627_00556 [Pseudomonas fluorescens]VVP85270.1 hypothetical protein PS910_02357 [Pseudomonas fluorescens]